MSWIINPVSFWMVLARLGGFMMIAPGIKEIPAPGIFKVLIMVCISLLIAPTLSLSGVSLGSWEVLVFGVISEVGLGLLLGFVLRCIFAAVQFAGALMDSEMGFFSAQQLGVVMFEGDGIIGRWMVWIAYVYFWTLDYFSLILLSLRETFIQVPLSSFTWGTQGISEWVRLLAAIFTGGLTIAAPMIALMFFVTIGTGLISRSVQGFPLFAENFVLRILLGIGGFIFFLPLILLLIRSQLQTMLPRFSQYVVSITGH
jgi:flagellar biosynthetic protein FliR